MDAWFLFDAALVTMMIFETWFISAFTLLLSSGDKGPSNPVFSQGAILRLLRLLRLTRMTRMLKMLRFMPELMVFIQGLRDAMRSMFCAFVLLVLVLYFASVALAQLGENYPGMHGLVGSTVPEILWFLLISTILPGMWDTVDAVGDASWHLSLVFVTFMMIAGLVVLNMLVGVLVEVVANVMNKESDRLAVGLVASKMQELFLDTGVVDHVDGIDKDEFDMILLDPSAAAILEEVGVDVVSLVDFADEIFSDCTSITFDRYVEIVMEFRDSKKTCVKDLHYLRKFMSKELFNKIKESLEEATEDLKASIAEMLVAKCSPRSTSPTGSRPNSAGAEEVGVACALRCLAATTEVSLEEEEEA
jgi:hypothetical protein